MLKKISEIKPDKEQPRKTFSEESLKFLAESILSNGLITPIDVDEEGIIIDGERRWKAHKLAGLKEIEVRVVKLKKDKVQRLKRQLISDLLDDKVLTEESYEAIVKLYKMMGDNVSQDTFRKEIGIARITLQRALNYISDKQADPDAVEGFSAGIWREVRSLPKEEREEIKKELKETDEPFTKIVEQKKEAIKQRKEKEKLEAELEETRKQLSQKQIKIITDRERIYQIREGIIEAHNLLNRLVSDIRWARKKKFFFEKPKQRDDFLRFLDGASDRARKWADELDNLKEEISIEILRE